MTIYAPLFSHEATPFTPSRTFTTCTAASDYARAVRVAQPGIEFEVMRFPPDADDWTAVLSGETPAEVQRRRWQDPPAAVAIVSPRRSGKTARARAAQQAARQA